MSEPEKKSKRVKLSEFKQILKAAKRTVGLVFKTAPYLTIGLVTFTLLGSLLPIAGSFAQSKVIDELIHLVTSGDRVYTYLMRLVFFTILIQILYGVIGSLRSAMDFHVFTNFSREFDMLVTTKFANLDDEYHEDPKTNSLIQKVRDSYGGRPMNFLDGMVGLMRHFFEASSAFTVIVTYSPLFIFLAILSTFPSFLNSILFGKRRWSIWDSKGDARKDYNITRWFLSRQSALQELKIFGVRKFMLDRLYRLYLEFQNEQKKVENKRALYSSILDLVRISGLAVAAIILVLDVLAKKITVGSFSFYTSMIGQLQRAVSDIFSRFSRIYEDGLFMVDIYTFLDLEAKIVSGVIVLPEDSNSPTIEVKNMSFKYPGSDAYAINGLNLTIKPGEHIAIVGENGAGKTTLVKLLARFYDVTDGSIVIDGHNIKDLDLESWYSKIGTIFQEFAEYHFDAKTNIGVGNVKKIDDIEGIKEAARKSRANEFIEKYEFKYDQGLSKQFKNGIDPSKGQWQRIALARAFFKNAPILILDEPTSAIDPKAEFEIFENLFEFTKGKTVIIISHRFSTVRNAQRILVFSEGKIIEEGSHESLMSMEEGVYKTAFDLQKKGYE